MCKVNQTLQYFFVANKVFSEADNRVQIDIHHNILLELHFVANQLTHFFPKLAIFDGAFNESLPSVWDVCVRPDAGRQRHHNATIKHPCKDEAGAKDSARRLPSHV